jgi:hypothetical protein
MKDPNRWRRKAAALIRLAEDQKGKPEGDVAREKLLNIINNHPEAATFTPIVEFARREVTGADVARMRQYGSDLTGRWSGPDAWEAMVRDYRARAHRAMVQEAIDKMRREVEESLVQAMTGALRKAAAADAVQGGGK